MTSTQTNSSLNSSNSYAQTVVKIDKSVGVNESSFEVTISSKTTLIDISDASARMLTELDSNNRSFALRDYFGFDTEDETSTEDLSILASIALIFEQPDSDEKKTSRSSNLQISNQSSAFPCSSVSWNATGLLLAVAYGMTQHDGWCNHRAGVAILSTSSSSSSSSSLTSKKINKTTKTKAWSPQIILDTDSCVTALAFHPREPAIIAAGTFSGEVIVWDVQRGLRVEEVGSGDDASSARDSNLDPLICKSRIDDFLHREAVCALSWVKDMSLSEDFLLVSVSREGKMLLWSLKNNLLYPISCSQVAVEPSLLSKDRGRGGKQGDRFDNSNNEDEDDDNDDRMKKSVTKRGGDSKSTLCGIGVSTMCALPETSGFHCIVGGESGFVMKCELSISSSAHAASVHKLGSPWRPEHKIGSLNRAENSLPWEQAAAEILLRASEVDRARICRGVEKCARDIGAKTVSLPLFLSSRPEAPLGVVFMNPVKSHLSSHVGPVTSVALHPSRRNVLLSTGADGRLCVYSTLQPKPLLELDVSVAAIGMEGGDSTSKGVVGLTSSSWSAVNPLLFAIGSLDGGVSVFDLFSSTSLPSIVLRGASSTSLGSQNVTRNIDLYNTASISRSTRSSRTDNILSTSIASQALASITSVSFNPRMHESKQILLAVGDAAGTVRVWRLPWSLSGDEILAKAALERWLSDI